MIGGWFKFHWLNPQHIVIKIDDKTSPLTKMFAGGQDFDVYDETYTFSINSFSRENVHVLTSINYDKMSFMMRQPDSIARAASRVNSRRVTDVDSLFDRASTWFDIDVPPPLGRLAVTGKAGAFGSFEKFERISLAVLR